MFQSRWICPSKEFDTEAYDLTARPAAAVLLCDRPTCVHISLVTPVFRFTGCDVPSSGKRFGNLARCAICSCNGACLSLRANEMGKKPCSNRLQGLMTDWLIGWLTDWLVDWLNGWLTDWLTDWLTYLLIGWLTEWLTDWLTDWLADWLTGWLTYLLTDWLTDWMAGWLTVWLTGWLNGWLAYLLTDWLTDWLADWMSDCVTHWYSLFSFGRRQSCNFQYDSI